MKLKSYCRGIGCGIIVAALVMMSAGDKNVSDVPEKKETLLEATMNSESEDVSSNVSSDNIIKQISSNESTSFTESEVKKDVSANKTEFVTPVAEAVEPEKKEEEVPTEITPPLIDPHVGDDTGFEIKEETVEIKVISGDSSVSVSRHLFEAGLVESAVEFDKYLCENGYDKFICVGIYDIEPGADFETIAKILTKR